jgi:hypothetical protein
MIISLLVISLTLITSFIVLITNYNPTNQLIFLMGISIFILIFALHKEK